MDVFVRVLQHPRAQGRFTVIAAMDPQPRPVLTTMAVQLRVALSRATETLALVDVPGDDDALVSSPRNSLQKPWAFETAKASENAVIPRQRVGRIKLRVSGTAH